MTSQDGPHPEPYGPRRGSPDDGLPDDDGPVIDPRDPLGLGDLPLDDDEDDDVPTADTATLDTRDVGAAGDVDPGAPGTEVPRTPSPAHLPQEAMPEPAPDAVPVPVPVGRSVAEPPAVSTPTAAVRRIARPAPASSEPTAPTRPPRSGWARLGHAMRPRTTQGQLIAAGLCALLGFALVAQVRQTTDTQLGALRQNDLVRLLDETTTRTDELEQESLDLQRERDELLSGSDRQQAALDAARRTAEMQGILTGRLPATGPGVRITLTEPDGEIRPATMLHVLEELRNAGAEALELNGVRITASSAFTGTRGAVVLDGVALVPPFRWTVIGDPDTIAPALEIPGGALARVRADLGRGTVEKSDRVDVTAVRAPVEPVHATPVADEG